MLIIKTYLKETPYKGIWLFVSEDIKQWTVIHQDEFNFDREYSLDFVQSHHLEDFFNTYASFNIQRKTYYLCVDNARFMNHDNDPNTYYDESKWQTIAKRNIKKDEEITCDYREFCEDSRVNWLGFELK